MNRKYIDKQTNINKIIVKNAIVTTNADKKQINTKSY